MAIGKDEVRRIAKLASLEFSEVELDRFTEQFNSILEFVATLDRVDVSGVEPTSHIASGAHTLREDATEPCLPRDEAVANAPETDGVHFKVPRVIG